MRIKAMIADLKDELVALRRDFHQHPELGFQEFRTSEIVRRYLAREGIETARVAGTGVLGLLKGPDGGRTILLRADMDALPVEERTGLPYQSVNKGVMHACGHDGHMAMLLVAAKILRAIGDRLPGNVKFAFQPNEEDAGAGDMIAQGIMENPRVDAAFGCHLWSQADTGTIDIRPGPIMAASHYFSLTIRGKGGHAGFAHESVDPILAASAVIQAAQGIPSREVNALDPVVVIFTEAHAGSSSTIIPAEMRLKGSIRVLYEGGEQDVRERFERIVKNICEAHRAAYELEFKVGNRLLSNDPRMSALARSAAGDVLGDETRVTSDIKTMAGEDFAEFAACAPAAFAFVGIRNQTEGIVFPHHHPRFTIDEAALAVGAELYVRAVMRFFELTSTGTCPPTPRSADP